MCIHLYARACVCVGECECAHTLGVLSLEAIALLFETGYLTELEPAKSFRLAVWQAPGILLSLPPSSGIRAHTGTLHLLRYGFRGLNSGLMFAVSTLPTELSLPLPSP